MIDSILTSIFANARDQAKTSMAHNFVHFIWRQQLFILKIVQNNNVNNANLQSNHLDE